MLCHIDVYTDENLMLVCDSLHCHAHDTRSELKPVSDSKPVNAHTIVHFSMNIHTTRNLLNWWKWTLHQSKFHLPRFHVKFQVD